jgi:hypothetical protein
MAFRRHLVVYVLLCGLVGGRFDEMADIIFTGTFNNAVNKVNECTGAGIDHIGLGQDVQLQFGLSQRFFEDCLRVTNNWPKSSILCRLSSMKSAQALTMVSRVPSTGSATAL